MDKLQVFISWSGTRSHAVAKYIKTWLPDVVRNAEPWLSSEDLRKGLQWLPELNKNLSTTGFGLLVLTADNKDAPWLVFEAGVISKALPDRHCCPMLCNLKQTDISGPLAQFQSTTVTKKEDMLQLVKTMNDASPKTSVFSGLRFRSRRGAVRRGEFALTDESAGSILPSCPSASSPPRGRGLKTAMDRGLHTPAS